MRPLLLAALALLAIAGVSRSLAPSATAETAPRIFTDSLAEAWRAVRADDDAPLAASIRVARALDVATEYAALPRDAAVLDEAADRIVRQQLAEGASLAERVIEVPQPPEVRLRAWNLIGFASMRAGHSSRAIEALLAAEEAAFAVSEDPLRLHRALWLARSALTARQPELAREMADRVVEEAPRQLIWHEARFLRMRAGLRMPAFAPDAIRDGDALLVEYPEYPARRALDIELAEAELEVGLLRDAAERLHAHVWQNPAWPTAIAARAMLDQPGLAGFPAPTHSLEERLARAEEVRRARHWAIAEGLLRGILDDATASGEPQSLRNEALLQLALNEHDRGNFASSLTLLDELASSGARGVDPLELARWRARVLSLLGQRDAAIESIEEAWSERSRPQRDAQVATYAWDFGLYDLVIERRRRTENDRYWQSWDGAFLLYLGGRFREAEAGFDYLAERASGSAERQYRYWQARTLVRIGRIADGAELFHQVADADPIGYYGILAWSRLQELAPVMDAGAGTAEFVEPHVTTPSPPPGGDAAPGSGVEASPSDAQPPPSSAPSDAPLAPLVRPGRIHWSGPDDPRLAGFDVVMQGRRHVDSYDPRVPRSPGLGDFCAAWAELFPECETAQALLAVGASEDARLAFRPVVREFRAMDALFREGRRESERRPIRIPDLFWSHEIDHRSEPRGWWGVALAAPMFPLPERGRALREAVARQGRIREGREEIAEQLRGALRELGDHHPVRRMVLSHFDLDEPEAGEEHDPLWLEAYPLAWAAETEERVSAYDVNPYLLWALMIAESDLNPDSVSRANAYGLLQVIPKTGDLLALRLGESEFGIHDMVEPQTSLRYGIYYLAELLSKFHGQEMLAVVAYNAGPHQVARWLDWRGESLDLDEFIETVPFDGARRYVQRIVHRTALYRSIYDGLDRMYVGNELDATYEDNIHF